ncbi:hypothetical protein [Chryseobacterium jejuense]|uniref:hypothetical protein n=1 Tax=Chryseobacterium jejuense TaxID=445960 RepID=UPI001AE3DAB4|nr:hypothetical protein [Chryseobacterium jejuense]MBP2615256.1 hypothetical protein [Chryseobacterium jejuense]
MAKLTISGSTQPVVGNTEAYSLSVFDNLISSNSFSFPPPRIDWNIHVQDRKGWRITHGNEKEGEYITYKFTHKSLQYKAVKIEVTRGKDKGELYIKPRQAEEPQILRVDLLDINSQHLQRGKLLHYTDTLIAKAHCVGMFGYKVSFTLWEDDAVGKGHDPVINMMNRINPVPLIAEVDHEGVAKVVFRLPSYTMAVQIANAQVARGDKSEGKAHEYYVTAEMVSKHIMKASPNVNVANPTHIPEPVKKPKPKETPDGHRKPPVAPENNRRKPDKPKPKVETPKFPQTQAAKKQADPEGKILGAEFTDSTGNPLKSAKTGDAVSIKIVSQSMKGKNVVVRIWEEDLSRYSNDLMYEKQITLTYDTNNFINGIILTKDMYTKSYEWGEGNEREYFIEVEHLNTSVTSQVITLSAGAERIKVDANDSPSIIKEAKLQTKNCGGKYCIDKNSPPSEIIREINIRLGGFGGNIPTDKFTERSEKMIKQFQRDYMKVPETGKVCGNVLRAIDEFSNKYPIPFKRIKCKCGKCSGFGNARHFDQAQKNNISEKYRKYEYPGIHRSIYWATKAIMHYFATLESGLGYKIGDISSGYRCQEDNAINKRNTTNHMGKALDLHVYKADNDKRANGKDRGADEGRSLFSKYSKARINWTTKNEFSLEPANIAPTWIHVDVREFELIYLKDQFFANSAQTAEGESIISIAMKFNNNVCSCGGNFSSDHKEQKIEHLDKEFDIEDAKEALKYIHDNFGRERAIVIEKMYRLETSHFTSLQYKETGTPGMEAHGESPYYGWDSKFWESNPEYIPMGLTGIKEGKGIGYNKQDTKNNKQFIIFPSVKAGMLYLNAYIDRYNGNYARWYSTSEVGQKKYIETLKGIRPQIVNNF